MEENKMKRLSELLKKQGDAFCKTLWELHTEAGNNYSTMHALNFPGGAVCINAMAGNFKVEVA